MDTKQQASESSFPSTRARLARERGDIETLLNLLDSSVPSDRLAAVANLGHTNDPRAIAALKRSVRSREERLRIGALNALGSIGDPRVAPAIYDAATEDESFGVRVTAIGALCSIRDPRAAELVVSGLKSSDNPWPRWYRKWATEKLVELNAKDAIGDLKQAKRGVGLIGRWRLSRAIRALDQSNL